MGLQLPGAKVVTGNDSERACPLYPISYLTPDSREQVEDIPTWGEWQLRDVAEQLTLRRENIERMSAGLARAVKHELAKACVKRDMQV